MGSGARLPSAGTHAMTRFVSAPVLWKAMRLPSGVQAGKVLLP